MTLNAELKQRQRLWLWHYVVFACLKTYPVRNITGTRLVGTITHVTCESRTGHVAAMNHNNDALFRYSAA